VNLLLAIPLAFRLAGLFAVGALLGSLANLAIYRLAWLRRAISPWSPPLPEAPPRRRTDRLPLVGWLGLRREAPLHGPGFWVRPMLLELLVGLGLAALYWWEIGQQGLWRHVPLPPGQLPAGIIHGQFLCHAALLWLMLVASVIDIDELIIPDAITVPGTLLGLAIAALFPWTLLPAGLGGHGFLHVAAPNPWPAWLRGLPNLAPLAIGLGCWWLWCLGLLHRTWYSRHGWRRAVQLMVARLVRAPSTPRVLLVGAAGTGAISGVWFWGGVPWMGLLTALVGMAAGGGLIWLVRIIGRAVLQREAMGFGDVTLMAMIGVFLGWQSCLVVFFLAPLAGLVIGLALLVLRRESVIPYGPFLCLAAAATIVEWSPIWQRISLPLGILGSLIPVVVAVMMVVMIPLLWIVRVVRSIIVPERTE